MRSRRVEPSIARAIARVAGGAARLRGWLPLALVALTSAPACLVTSKVDYDEPIIPPVVTPLFPAANIVRLPPKPDEGCGTSYMRFDIAVYDLNREDDLSVRIVVNGESETKLLPANNTTTRTASICARRSYLQKDCNSVVVLVSTNFLSENPPDDTKFQNDLGQASWWVLGSAEDSPNASHLDCEKSLRDGGLP